MSRAFDLPAPSGAYIVEYSSGVVESRVYHIMYIVE